MVYRYKQTYKVQGIKPKRTRHQQSNKALNYEGKTFGFIFGPVANDDVYTIFTLYTAGVLTKEQILEALKIKKLYNQLVLTSEKALSYLKFIGTVPEGEF